MPRFYSDLYTPPKRSNRNVPSIILYNKFHRSFSLDAPRQSSINNSYFHRETFPTNCYSLASILAYIYIHYTQGFSHLTKSFHYVYRNVTDKLFDTFAINFLDNFEIPFRTITDVFPQKSIFFPAIVKRHVRSYLEPIKKFLASFCRSPPLPIFVPWNA